LQLVCEASDAYGFEPLGPRLPTRGVKAVVNAADYLRNDEGAPQDRVLSVQLTEQVEAQGGEDVEARRTVMIIMAEPRQGLSTSSSSAEAAVSKELIVGAQTNAGRAAAAIAAVMRQDVKAIAVVRAMGAIAVHQALVSMALAQKYLNNDGAGVEFVVVPAFEDKSPPTKGGKPTKQLVLTVVRVKP